MTNFREGLYYSEDHEWVSVADGLLTIGITDFAQSELGDIVYVETAEVGEIIAQAKEFGSVEAVKIVSELYMPIAGEIVEINAAIADEPELLNKDPYEKGWIVKVRPKNIADIATLMNAKAYRESL